MKKLIQLITYALLTALLLWAMLILTDKMKADFEEKRLLENQFIQTIIVRYTDDEVFITFEDGTTWTVNRDEYTCEVRRK